MKLEVGKYYRTRDGSKVGPMVSDVTGNLKTNNIRGEEGDGNMHFYRDGRNIGVGDIYRDYDIIAEWPKDCACSVFHDGPCQSTPIVETGTIAELNVKPGDVVELMEPDTFRGEGAMYEIKRGPSGLLYAQHEDGGTVNFVSDWVFRIQQHAPSSPVRTVTRKEIVPGVYGRVTIKGMAKHGVEIELNYGDSSERMGPWGCPALSRDDLTKAIETLTEIRDALK